jgi:ornithine cyclodeaminase/alanine dehydrogenase-like protein (mu-crystallin family)
MTLVLTAADVAELLTFDDCIDAVERAFRAHGEEKLHPPGVVSAHVDRGAFHTKTASFGGYFAAKTNANFPSNAPLPTIQGVVILFDESNGSPLAVMDSIEITARRTAAATAVAAKYLARPQSHVVEVYGCGRQSYAQLEALSHVIEIEHVIAHDLDPEAERRFVRDLSVVRGLQPSARAKARAAHSEPDIIVTCTTSRKAFLHQARPGTFIAAVGADNPEKSEIAPELMRSSTIVTDVTEQAATIGDLHHAPGAAVHAQLGEIVAGVKRGRRSDDEIIIFDSTGVGFQDAAAAAVVYERAKKLGAGTEIRFA